VGALDVNVTDGLGSVEGETSVAVDSLLIGTLAVKETDALGRVEGETRVTVNSFVLNELVETDGWKTS
jgi:hypothetical protein